MSETETAPRPTTDGWTPSGMQDVPLNLARLLRRMRTVHAASEVVSVTADGRRRTRFDAVGERVDRLAGVLHRLGIRPGNRVGTFAWNGQEHLEAYFAVPAIGAVLHTANPRLDAAQVAYTIDHAADRVMLVDGSLAPQMAQVLPLLQRPIEQLIVIGEDPAGALPGALRYEHLLADATPVSALDDLDERAAAAICFTSGTTGNPKGVCYSHRTLVLHALAMSGWDAFRLSERDRALALVPMFHAMGWSLPYVAATVGADLLLPGRFMQPPDLCALIEEERATWTAGVPTILTDVARHAEDHGFDIGSLEIAICGGAAVAEPLMRRFADRHGIQLTQGWGMTETLPGAALAHDPPGADDETRWAHRRHAGRVSPLYELRTVDEDGRELPWDGETSGELEVRGPTVLGAYLGAGDTAPATLHDGWLPTGDIGTIGPGGWLRLTDRAKDVIKSGGEWISSVDLEAALLDHPAVEDVAVVAIADERWTERPLACLVSDAPPTAAELRAHLEDRVARWWIPDRYLIVDALPRTSVGKHDKRALRRMLADGTLTVPEPDDAA